MTQSRLLNEVIRLRKHHGIEKFTFKLGRKLNRMHKNAKKYHKINEEGINLCADASVDGQLPLGIQILMYLSERAYAQALVLRQQNTKKSFQHSLRRMRRACVFAKKLVDSCERSCRDNISLRLEAHAYYFIILGQFLFYRKCWSQAKNLVSDAKMILLFLRSYNHNQQQEQQLRHLRSEYDELINTIDPTIRFSVLQLQRLDREPRYIDIPDLQGAAETAKNLMKDTSSSFALEEKLRETALVREVTWRGKTVPIGEESLRLKLSATLDLQSSSSVRAADTNSAQENDAIYSNLIAAWSEIEHFTKQALAVSKEKAPYADSTQHLYVIHTFALFNYTLQKLLRDELLAKNILEQERSVNKMKDYSLPSLEKVVKVYDLMLADLSALISDPVIGGDDSLTERLEAKHEILAGRRCLFIAKSTSNLRNRLALLLRAYERCNRAVELSQDRQSDILDFKLAGPEELSNLKEEVNSQLMQVSRLLRISRPEQDQFKLPMVLRSNDFERNIDFSKDLVGAEPKLLPVPLKPVHFDIAYDYISQLLEDSSDLESSKTIFAQEKTAKKNKSQDTAPQKSSGFLSFFRG